jgi:hypothetical protein
MALVLVEPTTTNLPSSMALRRKIVILPISISSTSSIYCLIKYKGTVFESSQTMTTALELKPLAVTRKRAVLWLDVHAWSYAEGIWR